MYMYVTLSGPELHGKNEKLLLLKVKTTLCKHHMYMMVLAKTMFYKWHTILSF